MYLEYIEVGQGIRQVQMQIEAIVRFLQIYACIQIWKQEGILFIIQGAGRTQVDIPPAFTGNSCVCKA